MASVGSSWTSALPNADYTHEAAQREAEHEQPGLWPEPPRAADYWEAQALPTRLSIDLSSASASGRWRSGLCRLSLTGA